MKDIFIFCLIILGNNCFRCKKNFLSQNEKACFSKVNGETPHQFQYTTGNLLWFGYPISSFSDLRSHCS